MSTTAITAAATALVAAATVGGTAYAALWPQSQLFGKVLVASDNPHELALTYDDGPNPAATPQLLNILAAHNVRATFFLIGRFVRQQPDLTRQIATAGHLIGNHTMTHPWLAWQSTTRIQQELSDCNAILEDTLGTPIRYFRPPHGARRPAVLRAARELNLIPVNWNVIANDWTPVDAATILTRIQRGIARNQSRNRASNILLHDGGDRALNANRLPTVEATRQLLILHPSERFVTPAGWL
ncbi:polysaccharide deacetylase family protein [Granulicella arctica]|uniref:Peptidoglycan/xylan/chitin deacetylase (PgdA/CDA1 family) n=1 Tax=Granulicella arctica TaxID=940613 RepID=A0A7Y9PFK3_9BACT|nr:polysaccharide deacetylase family protein [Granulicella arctica]NYF78231.1 peptidoglycan/xylan/chitin deacetylase (PgdA/CDA1 family) [Granulicella arctica]